MPARNSYANSAKQREIMAIVCAAHAEKVDITAAELRGLVSYTASKQAILCSLKFLEKHGYIRKEPRAGNQSMIIKPTVQALAIYQPDPVSFPEEDES